MAWRTFTSERERADAEAAWRAAIDRLPVPEVVDWLVGLRPPPEPVRGEVAAQLDGLRAAARAGGALSEPERWVVSAHRDHDRQRAIWERKLAFSGPPFDRISDHARAVCGPLLSPARGPWRPQLPAHRRCWGADRWPAGAPPCSRALTLEERQREILLGSAAPGLSRHHWGTDVDLASVEAADWADGGRLAGLHGWLAAEAARFGFGQPFTADSGGYGRGPLEERWHWSYLPVARALAGFARAHERAVGERLAALWGGRPEYAVVAADWRPWLFGPADRAA